MCEHRVRPHDSLGIHPLPGDNDEHRKLPLGGGLRRNQHREAGRDHRGHQRRRDIRKPRHRGGPHCVKGHGHVVACRRHDGQRIRSHPEGCAHRSDARAHTLLRPSGPHPYREQGIDPRRGELRLAHLVGSHRRGGAPVRRGLREKGLLRGREQQPRHDGGERLRNRLDEDARRLCRHEVVGAYACDYPDGHDYTVRRPRPGHDGGTRHGRGIGCRVRRGGRRRET